MRPGEGRDIQYRQTDRRGMKNIEHEPSYYSNLSVVEPLPKKKGGGKPERE